MKIPVQMALAHANPGVEFNFPGYGDTGGDELSMRLVILGVLLVLSIMAFNTAVLTLPLAIGGDPISAADICLAWLSNFSIWCALHSLLFTGFSYVVFIDLLAVWSNEGHSILMLPPWLTICVTKDALKHEIWKCYQSTSYARAQLLQNLIVPKSPVACAILCSDRQCRYGMDLWDNHWLARILRAMCNRASACRLTPHDLYLHRTKDSMR